MITDRLKLTTKIALYGMHSLLLESIRNHSSGLYAAYKKGPARFFGDV